MNGDKKVEGRVTRSKSSSVKMLQDLISNLKRRKVETRVRLSAQGVDWCMAARMTMRSGCSGCV